jgi:hypothetical protein
VFESRIRAALAELEQYKTRMEGARLAAEVQGLAAQVYRVQLDGVAALVETYKARMQGVAAKAELERQRLLSHESAVQAYVAGINARTRAAQRPCRADCRGKGQGRGVRRTGGRLGRAGQGHPGAGPGQACGRHGDGQDPPGEYRADVAGYEARVRTAVAQADALLRGGEGGLRAYEALVRAKGLETDAKAREYASGWTPT